MTLAGQGKPLIGSGGALRDMPALTALRAVAALLVFLYHFPPIEAGWLVDTVAGQGHVGVTVFFVLSGFLITARYYPAFERGEGRLSDYFMRRVARILPLYYVVLTLTYLLTSGSVPLEVSRLPEWTLTQALFGTSPDDITVPTSWSLTVEECFYASAPLLFLALAAFRRRLGATAGAGLTLGGAVVGLYLVGSVIHYGAARVGAENLRFLSDDLLLRSYTIFGRMPDFALGVAAGLLFLSGRIEALWLRRWGRLTSTLIAAVGLVLLVGAEAGMQRDAADLAAGWRWNLLVALASAILVLALTCAPAPLSRLLALRPFVYLGRISYALYLIQVTPLGNGLMYGLLPGRDGVHLLALYVGMNLVSALLFELVEEPSRETILALWRGRSVAALSQARSSRARAVSLAILFSALAAQHGLWAIESLDPIDEGRVERVLGRDSPRLVRADVPKPGDTQPARVSLPTEWRRGRPGALRPPASLLVFVDGEAVPFIGVQPPTSGDVSAYYRRPRSWYLRLQLEEDAAVTVVHYVPRVAAALAWSRLREDLLPLSLLPLLGVVGLGWWRRGGSVWAPRVSLAIAGGLATVGLVSGLHLHAWAPLALPLGLLALLCLAFYQTTNREARESQPEASE